jgi:hypothetical protein
MPMERARYPENWEEISQRIRERDGQRCKWCGAANGAIGFRQARGEFVQMYASIEEVDGQADALALDGIKLTRIVLTVAHLGTPHADGTPGDKHDKMDVRDENLAALCQRCHLMYDLKDHVRNAAETRRRRRIEAGQMVMGDGWTD